MRIVIVYDNVATGPFKSGWGFSCYIKEKQILFDTGDNGKALLHNMRLLDIDPGEIEKIVLSHDHFDHTGGLKSLLEINEDVEVFVPEGFSRFKLRGIKNYRIVAEPLEISNGCIVSGGIDKRKFEQVMVVKTGKKVSVITGCAHPGLDRILDFAKKFGEIGAVIGGFHGFKDIEILKDLDLVLPCHCTRYKKEILEMDNSESCQVGKEIVLE